MQASARVRLRFMHIYGTIGIFFSKERREEVIEVEEEAEFIMLSTAPEPVKLMTQGQWMKGCPEGNEQAFLFALYDYLCTNSCTCPQACGYKVPRKKSDFFSLLVSIYTYRQHIRWSLTVISPSFLLISSISVALLNEYAPLATSNSALLAVKPLIQVTIAHPHPVWMSACFIVRIRKALYSVSGL